MKDTHRTLSNLINCEPELVVTNENISKYIRFFYPASKIPSAKLMTMIV